MIKNKRIDLRILQEAQRLGIGYNRYVNAIEKKRDFESYMAQNVFELVFEKGWDEEQFIKFMMTSEYGQKVMDGTYEYEWCDENYLLEGVENEWNVIFNKPIYKKNVMGYIGKFYKQYIDYRGEAPELIYAKITPCRISKYYNQLMLLDPSNFDEILGFLESKLNLKNTLENETKYNLTKRFGLGYKHKMRKRNVAHNSVPTCETYITSRALRSKLEHGFRKRNQVSNVTDMHRCKYHKKIH